MKRLGLDIYDDYPEDMISYLRNYGKHFNKKVCDYAVSLMRTKNPASGEKERLSPVTKAEIDDLMRRTGTLLENSVLYDYVFVANMCKADFLRSSVPDDAHMVRYVKDVIDDPDQPDGFIFNRWYADMCHSGMPIEWSDLL